MKKTPYAVSLKPETIDWAKNTLPKYQISFSSFVERCCKLFELNKEFKDLLLIKYYEEIEESEQTKS